ncbi:MULTISPECIES: hypothetical protein [Thermococcus]|jgi:uncharacterized protein YpmS|uniref:Uncharacterized protein n=2 Tax=Thermococcus TaxID=2263 RepID=A0A2Z2MJL1_9EURY|nr:MULTISPECIES: hypothetical protein [Thermococcus]ASJ04942.1 hypothetical protein A3L01_06030 [Thermococcus barossii]ASJ13696.1 hypothetical protein A3L10_00570 [Thermococcus radiotolerans]NJE77018.1 hypothetical protein [Thermococcus sp. ES12]
MAEALLYGIVIILIVLNIVLLMLYYSAKSNPYYVVYDEETKSALKRRVTSLKEDLESELVDFDVEEWEKTLEESIDEEVRNL